MKNIQFGNGKLQIFYLIMMLIENLSMDFNKLKCTQIKDICGV
jgi:hypothetical protein